MTMTPARAARALAGNRRGAAGIEFAMIASALVVAVFNVIDITRYAYADMEVNDAAQMGAQASWQTCPMTQIPATVNCPGLSAAVTASVQSTSLGTNVSVASGYPTEGYYCVNGSGALVYVAAVTATKPTDCSSVDNASATPGDWVQVEATYTYAPLFPALNIATTFPTTVTASSMMRLA
jgi:Flp pilus assembly protein TadG